MGVHFVLKTPLDEPLNVLPCLEFLLALSLLLHIGFFLLPFGLLLLIELLPDSQNGVSFVDLRVKFFGGHEGQVVLDVIEIPEPLFLVDFGVLDGDNIGGSEWLICHEIKIILGLFVELLHCLIRIDVP